MCIWATNSVCIGQVQQGSRSASEMNVNSEQDYEKAFSLVLLSEVNSKSIRQGSQPLLSKLASSTRPPPFRRVQPKPSLILQTSIPVVTCAQRPPCFASWSRKAC